MIKITLISTKKKIGEFGGKANLFKFKKYISKKDNVLDFGCGGGFLLNNLDCNYKAGIEINPVARDFCKNHLGIDCFSSLNEIEKLGRSTCQKVIF